MGCVQKKDACEFTILMCLLLLYSRLVFAEATEADCECNTMSAIGWEVCVAVQEQYRVYGVIVEMQR